MSLRQQLLTSRDIISFLASIGLAMHCLFHFLTIIRQDCLGHPHYKKKQKTKNKYLNVVHLVIGFEFV
jgi:hypothetical protein